MKDWTTELERGRSEAAWDSFLHRYRRLIFSAIRHYAQDYDVVMDAFVWVCDALRADDLRRLRVYTDQTNHRASFSTWLVSVVRHLTIDWFRHQEGRRRLSAVAKRLAPLRLRIFELVFLDQHSHVEAYELLSSTDAPALSFRGFLVELRETYRSVTDGRRGDVLRELGRPLPVDLEIEELSALDARERAALLDRELAMLDPVDRVAVLLYVVEEVPAAQVAVMLGLPNAKAVYNRVYRALALVREHLGNAGLRREDM